MDTFSEIDAAPERSRKPNVCALAFDATGRQLASTTEDGVVNVYDAAKGKLLGTFDDHEGVRQIALCGNRVWVGAGAKKEPASLSFYDL